MTVDPPVPPSDAVDRTMGQLKSLRRGDGGAFAATALKAIKRRETAELVVSARGALTAVRAVEKALGELVQAGVDARRREAHEHPYGSAWRGELSDSLDAAEHEGGLARRIGVGLFAWCLEISRSGWDPADEIAGLIGPTPDRVPDGLEMLLTSITAGLRPGGSFVESLPELKRLLDKPDLPVSVVVTLAALAARWERRLTGDLVEAARLARLPLPSQVPDSAALTRLDAEINWEVGSLARSAIAEVEVAAEHFGVAHALLDSPPGPMSRSLDLLTVGGELALREGDVTGSDALFDLAANIYGPKAVEPHLLRDVPANLVWRTARLVRLEDPEAALAMLNTALEGENQIRGKGAAPERRALATRAELLEQRGDREAAARDYHTAGKAYLATKPSTGEVLLAKAAKLGKSVPEYQLSYGEALRLAAAERPPDVRHSTRVDAYAALALGLSLSPVTEELAWGLVSAALVVHDLNTAAEPAEVFDIDVGPPDVLLERALLLNGGAARTKAFLIRVLRAQGYYEDLTHEIDVDAAVTSGDSLVAHSVASVLADLERDREVVRLISDYAERFELTAALRHLHATVLLRVNDPQGALDALPDHDLKPVAEVLRTIAMLRLARLTDAAEVLAAAKVRARELGDLRTDGWMTFLLGDADGALETYARWLTKSDELDDVVSVIDDPSFLTRDPARQAPSIRFDAAQMYLLRGQERDLRRASELLSSAIADCEDVFDLVNLRAIELPLLLDALRGRPHEMSAIAEVNQADIRIDTRCQELRTQRRDARMLGARLAAARRELATGDARNAFVLYAQLRAADGPPESERGMSAAAFAMRAAADQDMRRGHAKAAVEGWQTIWDLYAQHTPDFHQDERACLAARLALAGLSGQAEDKGAEFFEAAQNSHLLEAIRLFTHDVASAWRLYDGLGRLAQADDRLGHLKEVADQLPLGEVYGLGRDRATLMVESAIGINFGRGYDYLREAEDIAIGLHRLRDELNDTMGVRIPGAKIGVDEGVKNAVARLWIYGDFVGDVGPAAGGDVVESALGAIRRLLEDHLYRFVSNDDVDLWALNWDVKLSGRSVSEAARWLPPDPDSRARFGWVLRSLLREGVPIVRRPEIGAAFLQAGRRSPSRMAGLTAVRRAIYPAIVGGDAHPEAVALPQALAHELAEGVTGMPAYQWEMRRSQAARLLESVNKWRGGVGSGDATVIKVAGQAERLALARLLASARPRVYVVANEEIP